MEVILLGASLAKYSSEHREPSAKDPDGGTLRERVTQWEVIELSIDILRVLFLLALVFFYFLFIYLQKANKRRAKKEEVGSPGETTGLLNGHQVENGNANGHVYGDTNSKSTDQPEAWSRPVKVPSTSWWEYIRGYSLFFPYLWPAKSFRLQLTFVACFSLVLVARVVNILVPVQVGLITDKLSGEDGDASTIPWIGISLFIFYKLLQGNNGLLGALRSALWIPISQYSYQELATASFEHVHGLSLDFHLGKKTGEVLSALSKGSSINTFLEQVTFQVLPMLIDLGVAIAYFLIEYDAYYALVVAIVTFAYLYLTVRLAQWRAEIRREMVNSSRQEDAVK